MINDDIKSNEQLDNEQSSSAEVSKQSDEVISSEEDQERASIEPEDELEVKSPLISVSTAGKVKKEPKKKNTEKNVPGKPQIKDLGRQWYAVHTYSGYEDAVTRYLKQRVDSLSMNDKIFNIIVPKETKIKIKNGKRKTSEDKIYPGYVLVDMTLTEDSWYVVRNTPRVTGFVGPDSTTPTPLSREEIDGLMARMGGEKTKKFKIDIKIGDAVKVIDGPFKDYDAKVSEIDEEKARIKVLIGIFGRDTAVELDLLQVQKI